MDFRLVPVQGTRKKNGLSCKSTRNIMAFMPGNHFYYKYYYVQWWLMMATGGTVIYWSYHNMKYPAHHTSYAMALFVKCQPTNNTIIISWLICSFQFTETLQQILQVLQSVSLNHSRCFCFRPLRIIFLHFRNMGFPVCATSGYATIAAKY